MTSPIYPWVNMPLLSSTKSQTLALLPLEVYSKKTKPTGGVEPKSPPPPPCTPLPLGGAGDKGDDNQQPPPGGVPGGSMLPPGLPDLNTDPPAKRKREIDNGAGSSAVSPIQLTSDLEIISRDPLLGWDP